MDERKGRSSRTRRRSKKKIFAPNDRIDPLAGLFKKPEPEFPELHEEKINKTPVQETKPRPAAWATTALKSFSSGSSSSARFPRRLWISVAVRAGRTSRYKSLSADQRRRREGRPCFCLALRSEQKSTNSLQRSVLSVTTASTLGVEQRVIPRLGIRATPRWAGCLVELPSPAGLQHCCQRG